MVRGELDDFLMDLLQVDDRILKSSAYCIFFLPEFFIFLTFGFLLNFRMKLDIGPGNLSCQLSKDIIIAKLGQVLLLQGIFTCFNRKKSSIA